LLRLSQPRAAELHLLLRLSQPRAAELHLLLRLSQPRAAELHLLLRLSQSPAAVGINRGVLYRRGDFLASAERASISRTEKPGLAAPCRPWAGLAFWRA